MAYDGFRASQPYETGAFNNPNSYASSQQFRNSTLQAPYPDHYDATSDGSRFPATSQQLPQSPVPPPLSGRPPTNYNPDPFSDPLRFYQNNNAPAAAEATSSAFQQKVDISPEIIAQITASVVQQLKGLNVGIPQARPPPDQPQQNSDLPPFTPAVSEASHCSPSTNKIYTPPSPFRQAQDGGYQSSQFSNSQYAQNVPKFPRASPEPERASRGFVNEPHDRRPKPSRLSTQEETPVEKTWGQLFDKDGQPTPRLGQFLRGIAVHVIEAYPPGDSIVITPEKMQKYYEDTKSPTDPYPWKYIFDDRTSSISRLYREIQAEHHLVQDRLDKRPEIPGLTPRGFERWMRVMIVAHPEKEYQRLQRTVLEMPINNPDDRKERFPKELPRRLFPKSSDQTVKENLERSIVTHCHVDIPKSVEKDQSQSNTQRRRATSSIPTPPPLSGPSLNSPFEEDEDECAPVHPIERERKPYSVQPGAGKFYEDNFKSSLNIPVEQTKSRDSSGRGGTNSPSPRVKLDSKDFKNRDTGYVKTPVSARFREEGESRYVDQLRERKEESVQDPSRASWDTDDEDYYRATDPLGGRGGRHSPAYDDRSQWPFH